MSQLIAQAAFSPDPERVKTHELERLVQIADAARDGTLTEDAALMFLMCAPAIFREALAHRQRTEAGLDLSCDLTNVVSLPPKGGAQ